MKREIVVGSAGSSIKLIGGRVQAASNIEHRPGSVVYIFDGVALGQQRRQSAPRHIWATVAAAQTPAGAPRRFADADELFMYYVSDDFSTLLKCEAIVPPSEDAQLVLHCYDADNEYLVWSLATGDDGHNNTADYTVEKYVAGVQTLVGVVSDYEHRDIDGYINAGGDLIWAIGYPVVTMVLEENDSIRIGRYAGVTKYDEQIYVPMNSVIAFEEEGKALLRNRVGSTVPSSVTFTRSDVSSNKMVKRLSDYVGQTLVMSLTGYGYSDDEESYRHDAESLSNCVYDLFGSNTCDFIFGRMQGEIRAYYAQTWHDWYGVSESWSYGNPVFSPAFLYGRGILLETGELAAYKREQDEASITGQVSDITTAQLWETAFDLDENGDHVPFGSGIQWGESDPVVGVIVHPVNSPYTNRPTDPFITPTVDGFWADFGTVNGMVGLGLTYELYCISGAELNIGETRIGVPGGGGSIVKDGNLKVHIHFPTPWPDSPVTVSPETVFLFKSLLVTETYTDYHALLLISCAIPSYDSTYEIENSINKDLGNGYVLKKVPNVASLVNETIALECYIYYQGVSIYGGQTDEDLFAGAWSSSEGKLVGLINDGQTLVEATGSNVSTRGVGIGSNIVTRRFV